MNLTGAIVTMASSKALKLDDGNNVSNDGCGSACIIEGGWIMPASPRCHDLHLYRRWWVRRCLPSTLFSTPSETTRIVSGLDYGYGNNETAGSCSDLSFGTDNFAAQNGEGLLQS